jgi:hypothetical protein
MDSVFSDLDFLSDCFFSDWIFWFQFFSWIRIGFFRIGSGFGFSVGFGLVFRLDLVSVFSVGFGFGFFGLDLRFGFSGSGFRLF